MDFFTDEDIISIIEHKSQRDGDFMGFVNDWGVPINWDIKEKNKQWHETFFTKRAIYDHQAKGNCTFCQCIIKDMEKEGWLQKGDIILDPMCGIGSFNIVAALLGYDSIGVELEDTFYKDMVGFDTREEVGEDDLFGSFLSHVDGTIERFLKLTADIHAIGDILIVKGDARNLKEVLRGYKYPNKVICSPPYGNRMRDEGQRFGSKDGTDWSKREDHNKQYSLDKENIGNAKVSIASSPPYSSTTEIGGGLAKKRNVNYSDDNLARNKIKVITSPPYGRSTEHSEKQIKSLDKPGSEFHGHRPFKYGKGNIALLQDNKYSQEMLKVYKSMYEILEPGAHVALVTRNFIQEFKVVELDVLTIKLMVSAGFCYIKTRRARLPELSMFKHMNYTKYHKKKGLPKIDWEEVSYFVKPNRAL